jgi:hypothetical protein
MGTGENGYPEYEGDVSPGEWIGRVRAIVRKPEKRKDQGTLPMENGKPWSDGIGEML